MILLMDLLKSLFDDGVIGLVRMCLLCQNFQRDVNPGSKKPHRCRFLKENVTDKDLRFCSSFNDGSYEVE